MTETIGFIGLGVLGSAMAGNLVKDGFTVVGFDTVAEKMTALEGAGGQSGASPRDVADKSDVMILCLPTADALHDVVGGQEGHKDGLCGGGRAGQIVLETSTFAISDKEQARDALAASGKILLDCPVSGNRILALKKQLTAFGSGDRAAYDAAEHIIQGFADRAFYVGDFGCDQEFGGGTIGATIIFKEDASGSGAGRILYYQPSTGAFVEVQLGGAALVSVATFSGQQWATHASIGTS